MKKNNSFTGSNAMYQEHDEMQPPTKKEALKLNIANCRGKKPVLTDIKRARNILNNLLIELNGSAGERAIKKCTSLLWGILEDNK